MLKLSAPLFDKYYSKTSASPGLTGLKNLTELIL
jgi:hypothetical protein